MAVRQDKIFLSHLIRQKFIADSLDFFRLKVTFNNIYLCKTNTGDGLDIEICDISLNAFAKGIKNVGFVFYFDAPGHKKCKMLG